MNILLHEIQRYVKLCDPSQPLGPEDPRYVDLDQGPPVRGSDHNSCIDALYKTILRTEDSESCQLFTGFRGTGKTTELRRLEARLREAPDLPTYPIYVNFEEYIDFYTPISITDILRVLAYCMDREATLAEGDDPDEKPGYLRRFFDFVAQNDAQLRSIGFQKYGTSLILEIKNNPTFRQKIQDALALRFQQFAEDARSVMTEAVVRLRQAKHTVAHRVVVLADGLEKITWLEAEDQEKMEASAEAVFRQHSRWLRLPCHVIYTFPLWLRFRTPDLGTIYDQDPLILPMVKVTERDGRAYGPGLGKLKELVGLRLDQTKVFGSGQDRTLDLIIAASGGYPRDLLRMVRELLIQTDDFPVKPSDCMRIIAKLEEEYARVIRSADIELLRDVAVSHSFPLGDEAKVERFGRLFDRFLLLAYRNGTEWYDLHPLVRQAPVMKEALKKPST